MKKSNFVKGKMAGLIRIFYTKFKETIWIELPEKIIMIYTDGSISIHTHGKFTKMRKRK